MGDKLAGVKGVKGGRMEQRSKVAHRGIQASKQIRLNLALLVFLMSASFAMAQLIQGAISGVVRDETAAVLPGVEITIANIATGITRSSITDEAGRYGASSLPVGEYQIRAELPGFQTTIREGIELTVGRQAVVDLVLQIGEVTEEVTVSGQAPPLETSTASVSNLVEEKQVLDLPLNNRDLTQLTYLQPGVLKVPSSATQGHHSGMGDKLTVAGARGTHNLYLLDGVSNSDLSGNTQGSSGSYIGVDTVKELQIITNNYSAEYRSAAGAIISVVTKSGTNEFHGSAFEFLRNDTISLLIQGDGQRTIKNEGPPG